MTYRNCKKLIEAGRYEYNDMLNKLDVFLLGNRITQTEYEELIKSTHVFILTNTY